MKKINAILVMFVMGLLGSTDFVRGLPTQKLLAKYHRATVQEERQVTYTPKFGSEAFHL